MEVKVYNGVGYFDNKKCEYYEAQFNEHIKTHLPGKLIHMEEPFWYNGILKIKVTFKYPLYGGEKEFELNFYDWKDCKMVPLDLVIDLIEDYRQNKDTRQLYSTEYEIEEMLKETIE